MARNLKVVEREVNGEKVFIRRLNGSAYAVQALEVWARMKETPLLIVELGALLVVCCLCDEAGNPLYSNPVDARNNEEINFLTDFAKAAMEHSGLTEAEDLSKNSPAVQSDSSSSG